MKYSLVFAGVAAAYDAYSVPASSSSAYNGYPAASSSAYKVETPKVSSDNCLATVTPGYGKQPVTVTSQYQPYPTCVSAGYGGQSCDKWGEEKYVSTTIKDYDNHECTITKTNQPVTVYHEKKTITHTESGKYNAYSTPAAAYPTPSGGYTKDQTSPDGCWYEAYEKIETAEYSELGPHALKGYPGSGLCDDSNDTQKVHVKEFKNGKWSEYDHEHAYGAPKAQVTSYSATGVYTIPAKDMTVDSSIPYCAEATTVAKAGETCTYGGQYAEATTTGYVTAPYGAYETSVYGDKTSTSTVVKYTTIYVSTTGKYEVCKPTTSVYDKDTTIAYPTASHYEPGVYHFEPKTVTVTKPNEPYTCEYEQTKKYSATGTPLKGGEYPAYPTASAKYEQNYGYPSATPKKPTEGNGNYPVYPVAGNSTGNGYNGYASQPAYPVSTPAKVYGENAYPTPSAAKPYGAEYPSKPAGYPAAPSSTPCDEEEEKKKGYPTASAKYPEGAKPTPYGAYPAASSTPAYPAAPAYTPVYGGKPAEYPSKPADGYPAAPSSTPCDEEKGYPTPTPVKGQEGYGAAPASSKAAGY